jgi:hypothetical protein
VFERGDELRNNTNHGGPQGGRQLGSCAQTFQVTYCCTMLFLVPTTIFCVVL